MNKRTQFIRDEAASRDTIDVKRVYVVMCGGNYADAVMLSQIIYWNLPSKAGKPTKLVIKKHGYEWMAKTDKDWYDEIAMNEYAAGRARRRLVKMGFIESKVYRFDGLPTSHIRIKWDNFLGAYESATEELYRTSDPFIAKSKNRFEQKAINVSSNLLQPLTESTTETTAEITCSAASGESFQFKYPKKWPKKGITDSWMENYKPGYIQEKIDYVEGQESKRPITEPWRYVKAALEGNWSADKSNGQAESEDELIAKFRALDVDSDGFVIFDACVTNTGG